MTFLRKGILLTTIFLVSLLVLSGCGLQEQNDVVAVVNGEELKRAEFDEHVAHLIEAYASQGTDLEGSAGEELRSQLEEQVLDQMIVTTLLLQQAIEEGISADEEAVTGELEGIIAQFESETAFEQALEAQNLSRQELEQDIAEAVIIDDYLDMKVEEEGIAVSEEELQLLYEMYADQQGDLPSFEDMRPRLEAEVYEQKSQEILGDLIENLREQGDIEVYL